MAESFRSAAERHWSDANFLHGDRRLDNADHLVGFAAECAIKYAIESAGLMSRTGSGLPAVGIQMQRIGHLADGKADDVWQQAKALSLPSALLAELNTRTPFAGWRAEQRYDLTGSIAEPQVQTHMDAARRVLVAAGVLP